MKAKNMFLDFVNFMLYLFLIIFCIVYTIEHNDIKTYWEIIKILSPFIIVLFLMSIKFNANKKEFKKRTKEDNLDIVLYLTFFDKILSDAVLFLAPAIILLIAYFFGKPDVVDMFQALTILLLIYLWQKYLFSKTS